MTNPIALNDPIIKATAARVVKAELVGDEWHDDHILCFKANVTLDDGTSELVEFWWAGPFAFSAVQYCDESPRALEDVRNLMVNRFETAIDIYNEWQSILEDDPDETLDKQEVGTLKLLKMIG